MKYLCLDTGICVQESLETLNFQQNQLMRGKRHVQMFPIGTFELPLLDGFVRHENKRGVFHINSNAISLEEVEFFSSIGRENEFLNLGPYSKDDIAARALVGEIVTCISEVAFSGMEIRTAAATNKTLPEQYAYFESTKESDSLILIDVLPDRVRTVGKGII